MLKIIGGTISTHTKYFFAINYHIKKNLFYVRNTGFSVFILNYSGDVGSIYINANTQ